LFAVATGPATTLPPDAHGAAHFGFKTVWVNRAGAPDDNLPGKTVAEIKVLSQLPSLLGVA
jgi:2-haloacid dehalogenase